MSSYPLPPQQPHGYPTPAVPQSPGSAPQPPYGQQPYGQPPYGQPPYGQPYATQPKTNTLALVGFILSVTFILSFIGLILSIVGLIQINGAHGAQKGKGLAIAGIIVGATFFALGTISKITNLIDLVS